jgi:hypothetical protein
MAEERSDSRLVNLKFVNLELKVACIPLVFFKGDFSEQVRRNDSIPVG